MYKMCGVNVFILAMPLHLQTQFKNIIMMSLNYTDDRKMFDHEKVMALFILSLELIARDRVEICINDHIHAFV